ncbi:MAG TPA: isoprenylcysteine carboxylmethyltransferase family protein [Stellaceae bacterium]
MDWAALTVGLVALERVGELVLSHRHTKALLRDGGYERGRDHYPLIVGLHVLWLAAVYLAATPGAPPLWGWIGIYLLLQIARYWVIATLGRYWTTRIITVSKAPLVEHGPYRFLRHPNYAVIAAEVAVLPLAFGEASVALVFSVLNALLLAWRIRIEQRALFSRR